MEALKHIDYKVLMIFSGIFLSLFTIAELVYHFLKVNVGYTRKFVHICTGIIALYFPIYIKQPLDLILLCTCFAVILALSKKLKLLPSINAIDRASRGSIMYPIVVIICFVAQFYWKEYSYFLIPILVLALADPMAEFTGKKLKYKPYSIFGNSKTISGSAGFFVVAVLTSIISLYLLKDLSSGTILLCSIVIAMLSTIGEAVSLRGYDNLIIPLCVIAGLLIFGI